MNVVVVVVGAIAFLILALLLWAQWKRWQEKKLRRAGITTIAVGGGHASAAGCLGIAGYLSLLFMVVGLAFDIVEESTAPGWLAWVVVIGLLVGFFAFVAWASMGVGSSFALTRLVLDSQGIRLTRSGKTQLVIRWGEPWQLGQYAGVHFRYRHLGENYTDYTLWFVLQQENKRLQLRFDTPSERIGGLPPYEGSGEGLEIVELSEWLQVEILQRHALSNMPAGVESDISLASKADETAGIYTAISPDPTLMKALNFSEEDLAFNREGAHKVSQLAHLQRDRWITLGTYGVMALLFGWLAARQVFRPAGSDSTETRVAALIVFLLVFGFCTLMALVSYADIRFGIHVSRTRGTVTLQHYEQSGEYWLRIKDSAVPINKHLYDVFEDQALYDLYFAYHGLGDADRTLISAEKVVLP
jgi:hypothetical protein